MTASDRAPPGDGAVVGQPPLADIQPRHDLQAGDDGGVQVPGGHAHRLIHLGPAVLLPHPWPRTSFFWESFPRCGDNLEAPNTIQIEHKVMHFPLVSPQVLSVILYFF